MTREEAERIVAAGPPPTGRPYYDLKQKKGHEMWRSQYDKAKRLLSLRQEVREVPGPIPPDDMESIVSRVLR